MEATYNLYYMPPRAMRREVQNAMKSDLTAPCYCIVQRSECLHPA
jgi:hypothetical protein